MPIPNNLEHFLVHPDPSIRSVAKVMLEDFTLRQSSILGWDGRPLDLADPTTRMWVETMLEIAIQLERMLNLLEFGSGNEFTLLDDHVAQIYKTLVRLLGHDPSAPHAIHGNDYFGRLWERATDIGVAPGAAERLVEALAKS